MKVILERKNEAFHYEAITDNKIIVQIDGAPEIGGENKGARPMELVLMGIGGCASIDLGIILKKQKLALIDYNVEVNGTRTTDPAKSFKSIHLHFNLWGQLDPNKIERAIELTLTKYCSVVLSLDKEIIITNTFTIH